MKIEISFNQLETLFSGMISKEDDYNPTPFPIRNRDENTAPFDRDGGIVFTRRFKELLGPDFFHIYSAITRGIQKLSGEHPIKDIFEFVNQINKTMFISESLFSIEKITKSETAKPIRTHLLHPAVVYLIGKMILESKIENRKFQDNLAQMLAESKLGGDALRFAGYKNKPEDEEWQAAIKRAWCIASLSHDIVYSLEPAISIEKRFYDKDFLKNSYAPSINSNLKIFRKKKFKEDFREVWDIIKKYFLTPIKTTKKEKGQLNHGQLMAVFIINRYYNNGDFKKLKNLDKLSIFLSLVMIFRHDEWSKPSRLKKHIKGKDPLTTFFCLNDLLAEMRYVWNPVKRVVGDENRRVTWEINFWLPYTGISIMSNFPTCWNIEFIKNPNVDSRTIEDGNFKFDKSCGKGNDEEAIKKRKQYKKMLYLLNLAEEKTRVCVN